MKRLWQVLGAVCCGMCVAVPAWAAGSGAFRIEVPDAGALGSGGAFAARADNPSAVFYNPAGMTQIKSDSVSMGVCGIFPKVDAKPVSGGETEMRRQQFFVPSVFYVTDLGIKDVAFGVGATSSWGLGTEWAQDAFTKFNATRSEVRNQDYMLTAAYQLTERVAVGAGVDIDASEVDKQKKLLQGTGQLGNFRLRGDSTRAGFRVATMYKPNGKHQFGLMYRSAIEHKYTGLINLDDLINGSGSSNYNAIFGGSSYETDVVARSTLPQSAVLGYAFRPGEKWIFSADIEWMDWSSTKKEELAYPTETDPTRLLVLNDGNPAPRDWNDAFSTALGVQYSVSDRLRLRGGYFYHQTPIPGDTFEANLPDADSHSPTIGLGYDINKSLTLDLAYSSMFYKSRVVDNGVASGTINATYTQRTDLLAATVTYAF